jgi:dGTPase
MDAIGTKGTNLLIKPKNLAYFSSGKISAGNNSAKPANNQVISFQGAQILRSMALAKLSFHGKTIPKSFSEVAVNENNPKWENCISRISSIEENNDPELIFFYDKGRINYSKSFSRSKNKAQMLMLPDNDHINTRINHILDLDFISCLTAKKLGLNVDLASAIALSHDIGHAPFAHEGERALQTLMQKNNMDSAFWHAKNGIKFTDDIDHLNLTYAVRDGIICHSGKVKGALFPRNEFIKDLSSIQKSGQYRPYTWEGCVVKIADDISYLARDIDDAIRSKSMLPEKKKELIDSVEECLGRNIKDINPRTLTNKLVENLCNNSSPETGLKYSDSCLKLIKTISDFNKENITKTPEYCFDDYAMEVLETIFNKLNKCYKSTETLDEMDKFKEKYPKLTEHFGKWLRKYSNITGANAADKLYDIKKEEDYKQAIIDFMSGMTDRFAVSLYEEIKSEAANAEK